MIADFFIDLWVGLCDWFASTLPTDDPFDAATDGANWNLFSTMDFFLPVHELLSVFAAVFLLGGPMMIVTIILWVAFGVVRGGSPKA